MSHACLPQGNWSSRNHHNPTNNNDRGRGILFRGLAAPPPSRIRPAYAQQLYRHALVLHS